jgi:hypothetical protein
MLAQIGCRRISDYVHLTCLIVGHRRSRSRAQLNESGYLESVCRRCGVSMIRSDEGAWSMNPTKSQRKSE